MSIKDPRVGFLIQYFSECLKKSIEDLNEFIMENDEFVFKFLEGDPEVNKIVITVKMDLVENIEKLSDNAYYVLRIENKPLPKKAINYYDCVLQGQIDGRECLELMYNQLRNVYRPTLESRDDWGESRPMQVSSFLGDVRNFHMKLSEIVSSQTPYVLLRGIDRKFVIPTEDIEKYRKSNLPEEQRKHYEFLVTDWIDKVKKIVMEKNTESDVGPRSEIRYWSKRFSKLNSIIEQLKEKRYILKFVRSQVFKDWKDINIIMTDEANEAKDNVKYLTTLEKYIEILYTSTPSFIIDILPGLVKNIAMIHSISRYYSTKERITDLFVKITNQMIERCIRTIKKSGSLWEQDTNELITNLQQCVKLNKEYQQFYTQEKQKLKSNPQGKQFDFNYITIFGQFNLFCSRLNMLVELFQTIEQFKILQEHEMDAVGNLTAKFFQKVDDLKSKSSNLLDYKKNMFDKYYNEFSKEVAQIEQSLQVFINTSFDFISSSENALKLLKRFQKIMTRESLRSEMENKYQVIFHNYGLQLENIQKMYEQWNRNPPLIRDSPPVSGNILWARQLMRRIEEPMKKFREIPAIMHASNSKKVIRTYNTVLLTLLKFENLWLQAWKENVERSKVGLRASLLVKHKGKYYINFDPEIDELIKETKTLMNVGVEVSPAAVTVLLQEERLKVQRDKLKFLVSRYTKITRNIEPEILQEILRPQVKMLERKLSPALFVLTWSSLNIDTFLEDYERALNSFNRMLVVIGEIVKSRIERNVNEIVQTSLVTESLSGKEVDNIEQQTGLDSNMRKFLTAIVKKRRPYSVDQFYEIQKYHIRQATKRIQMLSFEVENAVGDIIEDLKIAGTSVSSEQVFKMFRYYENLLINGVALMMVNSVEHLLRLIIRRREDCSQDSESDSEDEEKRPSEYYDSDGSYLEHDDSDDFASDDNIEDPRKRRSRQTSKVASRRKKSVMSRSSSSVRRKGGHHRKSSNLGGSVDNTQKSEDLIVEPLIRVGVYLEKALEIKESEIVCRPSLHEFGETLNNFISEIMSVGRQLECWDYGADQSYYEIISQNEDLNVELQKYDRKKERIMSKAKSFMNGFEHLEFLFKKDKDDVYRQFLKKCKGKPTLENFETELKNSKDVILLINNIHDEHLIENVSFNNTSLKKSLQKENDVWKYVFGKNLYMKTREKLERMFDTIDDCGKRCDHQIDSLEQLRLMMNTLRSIREWSSTIDFDFRQIHEEFGILRKYHVEGEHVKKSEMDRVYDVEYKWGKLTSKATIVQENISLVQGSFKEKLVKEVALFRVDVDQFRRDFEVNGPLADGIEPNEAIERLKKYKRLYEERKRKFITFNAGELLFGLKESEYPSLDLTKKQLDHLEKLYKLYLSVTKKVQDFKELLWVDLNFEEITKTMERFKMDCHRLNEDLKSFKVYSELYKMIVDFYDLQPLLEKLKDPSLRERHWREIESLVNVKIQEEDDDFRLKHLLEVNLLEVRDEIEYICLAAKKEEAIEKKVKKIEFEWKDQHLTFAPYSNRGNLILKGAETIELLEKLEESQMEVGGLMSSRYLAPFRNKVQGWMHKLTHILDRLELWVRVQSLWRYLEAVFSARDIRRQLFVASKKFAHIDKHWVKIMVQAHNNPKVLSFCYENEFLNDLGYFQKELEVCQKSLSGYLEQKRSIFPRFYFNSDEVLLGILSKSSNPRAIKPYLLSIFDSVASLDFDEHDENKILRVHSPLGEEIEFKEEFEAKGNVEVWLGALVEHVKMTMKDIIRSCASDCIRMPIQQLVEKYPAQVALLGIQFLWTFTCEEAISRLRMEKKALTMAEKHCNSVLMELCRESTKNLSPRDRTKIETLVTIQVHHKDVITDYLITNKDEMKEQGHQSFEWQRQIRFYWNRDKDTALVRVADITQEYCYEYLGVKERLVITPLTDRCYITLCQALGMKLGGAPAGPAGTGKTETVKDLGRSIGKYVVVFNCSDQMDYQAMAKIYKGLAQSGAWGDFDEFNRIRLEVLSVVGQQIQTVLSALREMNKKFTFTDGTQCKIDPGVGIFITMNPGYQGRQELPENLKILFRGVSMMVPDKDIIIRVKLNACGYRKNTKILAKKFNKLYQLCAQQLSKQPHYDFGLRNILSVLRTAGETKRQNPNSREDVLIMSTLRDMNISKLVAEDVPLFEALVKDLFPRVKAKRRVFKEVEQLVIEEATKRNLELHPPWLEKVKQLYETSLVRHGFMVVGPSGSGKTACYRVLLAALSRLRGPHEEYRMNPKAIEATQMFGKLMENEWNDGIFSALWKAANHENQKKTIWIVCDGPVDSLWIENMNTVLDDNRLLTLANGDRIKMGEKTKMCFEVENLRNAAPSTVSRAGQIYVSSSVLGWKPVILSRMKGKYVGEDHDDDDLEEGGVGSEQGKRPLTSDEEKVIIELMDQWFDLAYKKMGHSFKPVLEVSQINLVCTCFELITSLVELHTKLENEKIRKMKDPLLMFKKKNHPTTSTSSTSSSKGKKRGGKKGGAKGVSSSGEDLRKKIPKMGLPQPLLEKIFVFAFVWSFGAVLEMKERKKFNLWMEKHLGSLVPPSMEKDDTVFDFFIDEETKRWIPWKAIVPRWDPSECVSDLFRDPNLDGKKGKSNKEEKVWDMDIDFTSVFIPTSDSVRTKYLMERLFHKNINLMLVGSVGSAKTVTIETFVKDVIRKELKEIGSSKMTYKKVNFSSLTTPNIFQDTIESSVERRYRAYGPPGGKAMTVFIDDISMPEYNEWGDQITNEIVRQLVEFRGFYSLSNAGDWMQIDDLQFLAAMSHPGGGKNDIPNRCKRHFSVFNLTLPSYESIQLIFDTLLGSRFDKSNPVGFDKRTLDVVSKLTEATIKVWEGVMENLLPTPSKFHYVFNLRDLSRIFQGIMLAPSDVVARGSSNLLFNLWAHENYRVFADRLNEAKDYDWFKKFFRKTVRKHFPREPMDLETRFVNFLREPEVDEDTEEYVEIVPKVYERSPSFESIRERVHSFMNDFNQKQRIERLDLVLFEDAVEHLIRLTRILSMKRGNALLVGFGGSGKQSLTRLASHICGYTTRQIIVHAHFTLFDFQEFLRSLMKDAGQFGKDVTFLFTDNDIKEESFLEYISMLISSGEIPGLFPKEDLENIFAELRLIAKKEHPNTLAKNDTDENMYLWFLERIREHVHIVLCFSPSGEKFRERARRFPALFSGCTIDWFFPWPQNALVGVAEKYLGEFDMNCDERTRTALFRFMAYCHSSQMKISNDYFQRYRKRVFATPQSFLNFVNLFKEVYTNKYSETNENATRVREGLEKISKSEEDVKEIQKQLKQKEANLQVAKNRTNTLIQQSETKKSEVELRRKENAQIKDKLKENKKKIEEKTKEANNDLKLAEPELKKAKKALDKLTPSDIIELRSMNEPPELVSSVMDCVRIMLQKKLPRVIRIVDKSGRSIIKPVPWGESKRMMLEKNFFRSIISFKPSQINEEMVELLLPYLEHPEFVPSRLERVSKAACGICEWIRAMKNYYFVAKNVKPKMMLVREMNASLSQATEQLASKEAELAQIEAERDVILKEYNDTMRKKQELEEDATKTRNFYQKASDLINALQGEKIRWNEMSQEFVDTMVRLVGDVALSCAFISYCGPYNSEFRKQILQSYFYKKCDTLSIRFSKSLNVVDLLTNEALRGSWFLQGLPPDEHSIQNAIMVTKSSRYPLLIDPQQQGVNWLKRRDYHLKKTSDEEEDIFIRRNNDSSSSGRKKNKKSKRKKKEEELDVRELRVCRSSHRNFSRMLFDSIAYGNPMIVENCLDELEGNLGQVVEKKILVSGKVKQIIVHNEAHDYDEMFELFLGTKLSRPNFSPELYAKTTVIDFGVTMKGLEEQLLAYVIQKERKELEEQRELLLKEVNENQKKILYCQNAVLRELADSKGDLLENHKLIEFLASTKRASKEINEKLTSAKETEKRINEAREEFRPVAIRGSVLYFVMSELSLVNSMYQTSLDQFYQLFDLSLKRAKRSPLAKKRVQNIINTLTYDIYRKVSLGLFKRHKFLFSLLLVCKILMRNEQITETEFRQFLQGGAALDIGSLDQNQHPDWLDDETWKNVVAISNTLYKFRELPAMISRSPSWRKYHSLEEPENHKIPEIDEKLEDFEKLVLVRSLRPDRTILASHNFIRNFLGEEFVTPIPFQLADILEASKSDMPIICLLSRDSSDPTTMIEKLAKDKKIDFDYISMGQGQEEPAKEKIKIAFESPGSWVLLQNCHLGLSFIETIEEMIKEEHKQGNIGDDFRLWMTAEPHKNFPIGLLQMSLKVALEGDVGLQASMKNCFDWISQDMLDASSRPTWKPLLYSVCFLHSIVSERRKFGAIGWNIPYEFNYTDLLASFEYLQNTFSFLGDNVKKGPQVKWKALRYMICEVHYGGKITDDFDRRLFKQYGDRWLNPTFLNQEKLTFFRSGAAEYSVAANDLEYKKEFVEEIENYPAIDRPIVFGLHNSADLTYRIKQSFEILSTITRIQPKEAKATAGSSSAKKESAFDDIDDGPEEVEGEGEDDLDAITANSPEQQVRKTCEEFLDRLPRDFDRRDIQIVEEQKRRKPLETFLLQEIDRLQKLINSIRTTTKNLIFAIDGSISMSDTLQDVLNSLYDAEVPSIWRKLSWHSANIGRWFTELQKRHKQLDGWLAKGKRPKAFWMSGFFNPQGFITCVIQEFCRKNKGAALDDCELKTEVKTMTKKEIVTQPDYGQGVYIHGLWLEGAGWKKQSRKLVEMAGKTIYTKFPIVHVSATIGKDKRKSAGTGQGGQGRTVRTMQSLQTAKKKKKKKIYSCPVYTDSRRNLDANHPEYIFNVDLNSGDMRPKHWIIRGVALLLKTD